MKTTGTFNDPNSPIYSLPYDPKGGSGIIEVPIWVTFGQNDTVINRMLAYSWIQTINGIEVEIEKPLMPNASALEEDIYNAMREEMKFDHLHFIEQSDLIWHRKATNQKNK